MSNETANNDPYKILGLPKDATESAIRGAYKKLMLQCHPDKVHDESLREEKAKMFEEVQKAYELLSDPRKRKKYDMEASGQRPSPPSGYAYPEYDTRPRRSSRSKSSEEQLAEENAKAERRRMEREERMREYEREQREKRERESYRSSHAHRYTHAPPGDYYSHSPPRDYPNAEDTTPKTQREQLYDEQLEEEKQRKYEAAMKQDVDKPAYVPGKIQLPKEAPVGSTSLPHPYPDPYGMHGQPPHPTHPGVDRDHIRYQAAREAQERSEWARQNEDMRHRESTRSRERMQQEADRSRPSPEAELADMEAKLKQPPPESRPRERRSSTQKEARPHISTEDLGEKRERRRERYEGSVPVDIPAPQYRPENPPHRASVSPPDGGVPRTSGRYGSAPAPPSASGGPTPMHYHSNGSPKTRRHSVSTPATPETRDPRLYSAEAATYDSGYSSPINPHPGAYYNKDPSDDNVSTVADLPPTGTFSKGAGNYRMYMPHPSERSPISPGYGSGPSPISAHHPMHPSNLNPGYPPAGYSPSSTAPRYSHGGTVPQPRRSSTVPMSPGSTVGVDGGMGSQAGYGRPHRMRESGERETQSQLGSRYGSGSGNTRQREEMVRKVSGRNPYGELPIRTREYTGPHFHTHPTMSRANTMPTTVEHQ